MKKIVATIIFLLVVCFYSFVCAEGQTANHIVQLNGCDQAAFWIQQSYCDDSQLRLQVTRKALSESVVLIDNQIDDLPDEASLVQEIDDASEEVVNVLGTLCDVVSLTDQNGQHLLKDYSVSTVRKAASLADTFEISLPKAVKQVHAELRLGINHDLSARFPDAKSITLTVPNHQSFFTEAAGLFGEHGEYNSWPLCAKQQLCQMLFDHGMIEETLKTEESIDTLLLQRYGMESNPDDLSSLSLIRMATVEMGMYTDWPNETWVWFSHLMLDTGLWNENSDADVYEKPEEEAIPSAQAIDLARQHLINQGTSLQKIETADVFWHYLTQTSDVKRENLNYLITFRFQNGHEQYVFLTPTGDIL